MILKILSKNVLPKKYFALGLIGAMTVCMMWGCTTDSDSTDTSDTTAETTTEATAETTDDSTAETSEEVELVDVVLNEVAHSIFYAPLYVAIENGYFEEEGINIELVTGFGADNTTAALLSNEADIGFMGPETTIYTYQEG